MRSHSFPKVSQQVVCVTEVPIGPTLGGPVFQLLHYLQICPENPHAVSQVRQQRTPHYRSCVTIMPSDLLVVLCCLPQCCHDLLGEISRLSSAPADTFPFGMVHVPKVIQSSCLAHLTQSQEKHVSA